MATWLQCCQANLFQTLLGITIGAFAVSIQTSMPTFCRLQKVFQPETHCSQAVSGSGTCSLQADVHLSWYLCRCTVLQMQIGSLLACTVYTLLLQSEALAAVLVLTVPPVVSGSGKNECWTDVAKTCCVHGRRHTR